MMTISITGGAKEIAALARELQRRPSKPFKVRLAVDGEKMVKEIRDSVLKIRGN